MQEIKINIELIKKMMNEKKTTLPSFKNQDWKNVTVETKNKILLYIPTANITELNKPSDGEVPVMLGLWGMQRTSSLPLLPGPLWPEMVAPDRALFMG